MKHILFLALQYLRFNRVKTVIMVFSVTVAVFLPLVVNLLVRNYQRDLLARAQATPLVAGAPGSRFDLVLSALYFRNKPAHDLNLSDADAINATGLALGLPVLNKHTARGLPLVGTTLEYFDFRGLRVMQGRGLTRLGECVLGAAAARQLKLHPGDALMSDPENVFDLAGAYPLNMRVAGILAPNGSADDGAVFVDLKTAWLIMGLMHGHQDAAKADPSLLLGRDSTNVVASAALLPYQEVTSTNLASYHMHGDPETYPVSAIIVVPRDEKSAAILRGRYQNPKSRAQLLAPTQVVAETLDLVFRVKRFFDAQTLLVGGAMGLLLALVVLLSLRLRQGEMETMCKIGCSRRIVFWLCATETLIVVVLGVAIAMCLAWLVVRGLGVSNEFAGAESVQKLESGEKQKRIAVVNYPLAYFTKRIAGDSVEIIFPLPPAEDPAFWRPDDKDILQYQQADLILLNGADYAKWLPTAVLPATKQVITSRSFADRYLKNTEAVTHSHGPAGEHEHGLLDFNTWLDPEQAALQAQSVRDELVRLVPEATRTFETNWTRLQADLAQLNTNLAAVRLGNTPLFASHPVYQYLARRYDWNLQSVHWEPDEMPSEAEWQKFSERHGKHAAQIMIWEKAPLPPVAERLRKMGIEPVVFETCGNIPDRGDYLSAMKANVLRLANAITNAPPPQ